MEKRLSYSTGAFITLFIAIGIAALAYGGKYIPFFPLHLIAWIMFPLGVYSLIYMFISGEVIFYLGLSSIMLAIAAGSILYNITNIFNILGVLLITLALIGLLAIKKARK